MQQHILAGFFRAEKSSFRSPLRLASRVFQKNTFYRTQVNLGSDLWVRMSLRPRGFADLTDVTLADEDTNSILTDNANRAIQGNLVMQVTQPGGKICN